MNKECVLNIDGSHNGYDYVDLGLPSGIKWSTCNVGANNPEDEGLLFQFGRTDGYKYGDKNHKFSKQNKNKNITGSKLINPTTSGIEYVEGQKLSLIDDMARANMGGNCIMPTKEDLQELYDNTTRQVVTINGKNGMLFTSNINGKFIFVVFAGLCGLEKGKFYDGGYYGYIWTSEVYSCDSEYAWIFDCGFYETCFYETCGFTIAPRSDSFSVRGVLK